MTILTSAGLKGEAQSLQQRFKEIRAEREHLSVDANLSVDEKINQAKELLRSGDALAESLDFYDAEQPYRSAIMLAENIPSALPTYTSALNNLAQLLHASYQPPRRGRTADAPRGGDLAAFQTTHWT